jgi:hypothetical protein
LFSGLEFVFPGNDVPDVPDDSDARDMKAFFVAAALFLFPDASA